MRIGLISDTHIPEVTTELPAQIREVFRDVDLILHAGDVYVTSVLDELEHIAPVLAAQGDDDYFEVMRDKRVKSKHVLTVEGVTIWLMHTIWLMRRKLISWHQHHPLSISTPDGKSPDIVVFGHTHKDTVEHDGDVLLVNPGSATFPNYEHRLGTVGLLTVTSGKAKVSIVQLK